MWERQRTVSLWLSPSDLPMSLEAQSSLLLPSLDWIPGTTRGMFVCGVIEKRRGTVRWSILRSDRSRSGLCVCEYRTGECYGICR